MAVCIGGRSHAYAKIRGAVAPELAISWTAFFVAIFLGIELVRACFVAAELNIGVMRTARAASIAIGQSVGDVRAQVEGLSGVTTSSFELCPFSSSPCGTNDRGSAGDWMQIAAATNLSLLFGSYNLTLRSNTVFRNEPNFRSFSTSPPQANTGVPSIISKHPQVF